MKKINSEIEFHDTISNGKVLVDFSAEWCGPCKILSEILKEVDQENIIDIATIDTDRFRGIAKEYRVMSVPTIFIFENGKQIKEKKGLVSKSELIDFINNN